VLPDKDYAHLSDIPTNWVELRQAHEGPADEAGIARQLLLQRYGGPAYRYLLRALGDPGAAAEVLQEFAVSLLRGQLAKADPRLGRFRNYLKATLLHLVCDYRRKQRRQPLPLPADAPELVSLGEDAEREFNDNWRNELLTRTWGALMAAQPTYYEVLRFRAEHPDLHSPQLAAELTAKLGRPLSAEAVRQTLHRARDRFADLLIKEVSDSLAAPTADEIAEELGELDLLSYCRDALKRYPAP
jgi:RNA polymerase sigma-70 factor (ECF subfamily)